MNLNKRLVITSASGELLELLPGDPVTLQSAVTAGGGPAVMTSVDGPKTVPLTSAGDAQQIADFMRESQAITVWNRRYQMLTLKGQALVGAYLPAGVMPAYRFALNRHTATGRSIELQFMGGRLVVTSQAEGIGLFSDISTKPADEELFPVDWAVVPELGVRFDPLQPMVALVSAGDITLRLTHSGSEIFCAASHKELGGIGIVELGLAPRGPC